MDHDVRAVVDADLLRAQDDAIIAEGTKDSLWDGRDLFSFISDFFSRKVKRDLMLGEKREKIDDVK